MQADISKHPRIGIFARRLLLAAMALFAVIAVLRWFAAAPALEDGDLIFQTSRSSQSTAIGLASLSLYTHMGIVKHTPDGVVVVEATGPVKETPLRRWIKRGRFGRYAVYRWPGLTQSRAARVFTAARRLYGRPYDLYFSFDNSAIYCSELAEHAFRAADIQLGERQRISDLTMLRGPAKNLLQSRSKSDPQCRAHNVSGDACLKLIMQRDLITPVSIARDPGLKQVYSNYPF